MKQIANFKETNDLVGYQNLVLNELQTEFGGAAREMTNAGLQTEGVSLAFGNLKEAVGGANAGWIQDFNRGVAYTTQGLADWVQGNVDARKAEQQHVDEFDRYAASLGMNGAQLMIAGHSLKSFTAEMERGRAMTEFYTKAQESQGAQVQLTEEQQQTQLDTGIKLTEMTQKFTDKTTALNVAIAGEQGEIDRLIKAGYNPMGEKIQAHMDAIGQLRSQVVQNNIAQANSQQEYALSILKTSNASAEMQRKFAVAAGLMTQGAANQQTAQDALANAFMSGQISAETYASSIEGIMNKVNSLDGSKAKVYIDIFIKEHNSSAMLSTVTQEKKNETGGQSGQHGGAIEDGPGPVTTTTHWKGGYLGSNWAMVGDGVGGRFIKGATELISPDGFVFDTKTSEMMLKAGLVDPVSRAVGGDVFSSSGKGVSVGQSRGAQAAKTFSRSNSQRGGNAGMAVNVSADAAQPVNTGTSMSVSEQQQQQQATIAATAANTDTLNKILNVLEVKLARDIGTQVGNKLAKFS